MNTFKMWRKGQVNINRKTIGLFTESELLAIAKDRGYVDEFWEYGVDTDTGEVFGRKELVKIILNELD